MFSKLNNNVRTRLAGILVLAAILGACGGGGGGNDCVRIDSSRSAALPSCASSSTDTTVATGTTAATIQLLVSSQQLNSAGTAPVDVTVIARDSNGQALSGRNVQFTVADPENTAFISNFSQSTGTTHATGPNGQLTATLNTGSSKANRAITLTATADGASASNVVTVTGTTLTISGSNALVFGSNADLNAVLTDSAGKPIASVPLKVTSAAGNAIAPASPTTDANGNATIVFTGSKAGVDKLTASGGGATASYDLTVSGNGFAFSSPVSGSKAEIKVPLTITVRWTNNGQPVANTRVSFTTTRGTLAPTPVAITTDANGNASTTLTSASPGRATITASGPAGSGVAGSISVDFESRQPAFSLDLQADKTTVSVNPPGIASNVATLTAVVRDVDNNRLANKVVNFRIDQDPTQGTLSTASAITDINGVAKSQYVPSSQSSPTNGVVISAKVADASVQSRPLLLTVASQNLFVRIGTDNSLETDAPNYIKKYSAFVTDAAGNPVPNATVQFLIKPRQEDVYDTTLTPTQFQQRSTGDFAYYKGRYVWRYPFWVPTNGAGSIPTGCYNEDVNFNGIYDPTEDLNGNGVLDTGNSYSVNASMVTNSAGFALASITYPKDRANWTAVTLKATAQVSGTEATATASFILPAASSDLNKEDVSPPGFESPYGTSLSCTAPR